MQTTLRVLRLLTAIALIVLIANAGEVIPAYWAIFTPIVALWVIVEWVRS